MSVGKKDFREGKKGFFLNPSGHPRDRIIINDSEGIPKEGIFLSLNGYAFLAKTGVEIDIPRPVREMLDTRIRTDTVMVDDGNGKLVKHMKNIPRISYTLVKADIDAPVVTPATASPAPTAPATQPPA